MLRFSQENKPAPFQVEHLDVELIIKNDDHSWHPDVCYEIQITWRDPMPHSPWPDQYFVPHVSGHYGFSKERNSPLEDAENAYANACDMLDKYLAKYGKDKNIIHFDFKAKVQVKTNASSIEELQAIDETDIGHEKLKAHILELHQIMKKQLAEEFNVGMGLSEIEHHEKTGQSSPRSKPK